jgi:hypothetical protein
MALQLEFFAEEKTDIDYLREDLYQVRDSNDKVRKSIFARYGELAKKYLELHERMQIIEQNICRGETNKICH